MMIISGGNLTMPFSMARSTQRNHIQPMFFGVAIDMMILLCLFAAIGTLLSGDVGKFTLFNSFIENHSGFESLREFFTGTFGILKSFGRGIITFLCHFAFLRVLITILNRFTGRRLSSFALNDARAISTSTLMTILSLCCFAKLVKWLSLAASSTNFHSHFSNSFLSKIQIARQVACLNWGVLNKPNTCRASLLQLIYYKSWQDNKKACPCKLPNSPIIIIEKPRLVKLTGTQP